MNEEGRCPDCKFDKEDDTFPNCKMCLDGRSGFEPRDEENCDTCMFCWSLATTKLQTACTNLKQELKALQAKNVELEKQLKKAKDKYETLVVSLTKSQLKPSDNQPSGE